MHKSRWQVLSIALVLVGSLVLTACGGDEDKKSSPTATSEIGSAGAEMIYAGKKVAFVDSYHAGYAWSDALTTSIETSLEGTGAELLVIHMDTKNNPGDEFGEKAAAQARSEIDAFAPDVLIACDDNAQKYLVVPYYKDTDLPVVFCGVNWDASPYGYPTSNITGMIEVDVVELLVSNLRTYAQGSRVGFLGKNDESESKIAQAYLEFFPDLDIRLVETYDQLQAEYMSLQNDVDMVLLSNIVGVENLPTDEAEVIDFFMQNTVVPTGSANAWLAPYSLITLARVGEEQGRWSVKAALQILDGTSPADIPVARNQEGELYVNLDVAAKLDVIFTPDMLRNAIIVGGEET